MKLYIESYQSKIEDLEPIEEKYTEMVKDYEATNSKFSKLQKELEEQRNLMKEKRAEWKLREQELVGQINKNQSKQHILEGKVKDLETFLTTNRTYSGSNDKGRPQAFTNKIEAKTGKAELILLKDES